MIGQLPEAAGKRDAFHLACVSVTCDERVSPGDGLSFTHYGRSEVERCPRSYCQGIVDPMLKQDVPPGTAFWMALEPGSTQKLTHSFKIEGEPDEGVDEDDLIMCRDLGCG